MDVMSRISNRRERQVDREDMGVYNGQSGQFNDQQYSPMPRSGSASTVASVRSSIDSQRSFSGRNKLQKKRTRED